MSNYKQNVTSSKTRFSKAPMGVLEYSKLFANPTHLTDFNGGDIVPIYCNEVLPHETIDMDMEFIVRQTTIAVPTMGQLEADYYAFFVPNRVVNHSWKEVMGENSSGAWMQDEPIVLASLGSQTGGGVQVPIGSVADYYGYPTQGRLSGALLKSMHDLKFRGYLEIYNTYFRDQNYQPPIPYSKLNIYNGFFDNPAQNISLTGRATNINVAGTADISVPAGTVADGQFGAGAVAKAFAGNGGETLLKVSGLARRTSWSALSKPLKANKFHDYFTSVLPYPQKSREVVIPLQGSLSLNTVAEPFKFAGGPLKLHTDDNVTGNFYDLIGQNPFSGASRTLGVYVGNPVSDEMSGAGIAVDGANLVVDNEGLSISVSDIRMSSAMQQVYEILGRSGSRYVEYINSFFGLDIDNPFDDIPTYLGHFRRSLDLYQTAQTSATPASAEGAGTAQGNLAAYGYTANGGKLINDYTFKEHGYIHVFAVVRHRNVYASMLSRDNFRMSMMDFYQYPLANISEQPVYSREINPFTNAALEGSTFGYQEAWSEYRYEPDRVSAHMRTGIPGEETLSNWNYADDFLSDLAYADGAWLLSNTEDVVERTTAVQDQGLPQFKGQFMFRIKKQLPMPTYSVAGMDII